MLKGIEKSGYGCLVTWLSVKNKYRLVSVTNIIGVEIISYPLSGSWGYSSNAFSLFLNSIYINIFSSF